LIIIPIIIAAGVLGEVLLLAFRRRKTTQIAPGSSSHVCSNCGADIEEEWTHCIHCGSRLGPQELS
jgi:predicted amidophosphoribosyltransferase